MAYLKDRVNQTLTQRKELAAALLLVAICTHGSIVGYPPFGVVMQLGKAAKKAWYADQDVHPPFPHAELMSLKDLARKVDFSLPGAIDHLHDKGFAGADGKATLKGLAVGSGRSPAQIFEAMMMDDRIYQ